MYFLPEVNDLMPYTPLLNAIHLDFRKILGENLIGMYVHGSIAFGCFTWEHSDVDFLAVVRRPLTHGQQVELIHSLIAHTPDAPPKGIEMSVVLEKYCRNFEYPTPFELHFSNGHLAQYCMDIDGHCRELHGRLDPDLAGHFAVTRAIGLTWDGPPADEVFSPVPREAVLESILADVTDCNDDPLYHTLNLCRTLAFVRENLILSKAEGARWAAERLPEEYREIAGHALHCYTVDEEFAPNDESDAFREMLLRMILEETSG